MDCPITGWAARTTRSRRTRRPSSGSREAAQKDPEPLIDLGTLYLEQNRPKDALPYLLEATRVAPEDAKGHEKLGKTFSQLDELPKAQSELEKAVALAPKVASLHYMLGQVYRRKGSWTRRKPSSSAPRSSTARILRRKKPWSEAIRRMNSTEAAGSGPCFALPAARERHWRHGAFSRAC